MEKEGREGSGPTLLSEKWKNMYIEPLTTTTTMMVTHRNDIIQFLLCRVVCGCVGWMRTSTTFTMFSIQWKKCQSTQQTNSWNSLRLVLFATVQCPLEMRIFVCRLENSIRTHNTHERMEFARVHYTVCSRDYVGIQCHFRSLLFIFSCLHWCSQCDWLAACDVWLIVTL